MRLFLIFFLSSASALAKPFAFHIAKEPAAIDPVKAPGEYAFLYSSLYRGLIKYTEEGILQYDGAEKCRFKPDLIVWCKLRKLKWSDGSELTAKDYVQSFSRIVSPPSENPGARLLLGLQNAKDVFVGKKAPNELGIKAVSEYEIEFHLAENDQEFLEKLSNVFLTPYRSNASQEDLTKLVVNGPYKIAKWEKHVKLRLEPNPYYVGGNKNRPPVEIHFLNQTKALELYGKGTLSFFWDLPTALIPEYKTRSDFYAKSMARFDYLAFNLRGAFKNLEVRRAFAEGIPYDKLRNEFSEFLAPGCPGFGENILHYEGHCLSFHPSERHLELTRPVKAFFQPSEWFQDQWRKRLGVRFENTNLNPDISRKYLSLDRPTCLAGLEVFKKDHPQNTVGFENVKFEAILKMMGDDRLSRFERESLCGRAYDILFKEQFVGIPLGGKTLAGLAKPEFKNWHLNELNQLDLADLEEVGPK